MSDEPPSPSKVSIEHAVGCRCAVVDGEVHVRLPCVVRGVHLTKSRLMQLRHDVKRGR